MNSGSVMRSSRTRCRDCVPGATLKRSRTPAAAARDSDKAAPDEHQRCRFGNRLNGRTTQHNIVNAGVELRSVRRGPTERCHRHVAENFRELLVIAGREQHTPPE